MVREKLKGISDDVIMTELDIELTEGDTASKGSQLLPRITAVIRGALSGDSREVQKCRIHFSDRTAELPQCFIYLSNPAVANSALHFPYRWWPNCISENKIGLLLGIFIGLFHCCRVVSSSFVLWNNG